MSANDRTSPLPTFGCIFARGGSQGVKRKNLRELGGIPLIGLAVKCALEAKRVDRIFVSTDDQEIADVAASFGAEVPFMRPAELSTNTAAELLAWKHFVQNRRDAGDEFGAFVSVPCTAPLRLAADVDQAVDALFATPGTDIVITVAEAHRNPYFNQVSLDEAGRAKVVLEGAYTRRQDVPPVFDITTVAYAATPDYVMATDHVLAGTVRTVEVPTARSLDIDTPFDLALAEFLWGRPELLS